MIVVPLENRNHITVEIRNLQLGLKNCACLQNRRKELYQRGLRKETTVTLNLKKIEQLKDMFFSPTVFTIDTVFTFHSLSLPVSAP